MLSLLVAGSLASIESIDERMEQNYEETASDIGQVDLSYFDVPETPGAAPGPVVPPPLSPVTPLTPVLDLTVADATVTGSMASDGTGFGVANGGGFNPTGPSSAAGSLVFTFTVSQTGTYRIEGDILAPTDDDNSFWVTVNGEPSAGYEWRQGIYSSYTPEYVNDGEGTAPIEVALEPGEHQVTIWHREDGTYLSGLRLELQ